ncbi:MAG: hydroxyacid dehydrogenase [Fimbriimonadaceae bacterium]
MGGEHSPTVLIAVGGEERGLFFPVDLAARADALPAKVEWLDPAASGEGAWDSALESLRPEIVVAGWGTPVLADRHLAVYGGSVRYLCYLAGSVRGRVTREQIEAGLLVTNWGSAVSRTVAECALLLIVASLRQVPDWVRRMDAGAWREGLQTGRSLFGRKVGIHGLGSVTRELVRLLAPFDVSIAAFSEGVPADRFAVEALTPQTRGLVGEDLLARLRPGSVFVNVGRGAVVDERALVRVARKGEILIGLDVYADEPLPADHPLRGLPNVLLLPHVAGPTPDRMRDAGELALQNLGRYLDGEPPTSTITPEVFDRIS